MDTRTEQREWKLVLRSAWEGDGDKPFVETIQAANWEEAAERAMGIRDVLLVGLFPADEEERLRGASG